MSHAGWGLDVAARTPNQFVRADVEGLYGKRRAYCGRRRCRPGQLTCDHVIPLSRGGDTWADNLLPACRPCNGAKADMTIPEFRLALERALLVAGQRMSKGTRKAVLASLEVAKRCLVAGQIRFWFERHRPAYGSPVLEALRQLVVPGRPLPSAPGCGKTAPMAGGGAP